MTAQPASYNGGWAGFHVNGNAAAAHAAMTDLTNILDTVEVPIVVVGRDLTVAGFNHAAADVLGLSLSDTRRATRDFSVLAGLPRLEQHCREAITGAVESRIDFSDEETWFVVRISPYPRGGGHPAGAVLTFTNVTAFRASIDQAIYERESTKAILNTVADPLIVLSADQRIQSGNRAFYTMFGVSRDDTQGIPIYELANGAFEGEPIDHAHGHAYLSIEVIVTVTAFSARRHPAKGTLPCLIIWTRRWRLKIFNS